MDLLTTSFFFEGDPDRVRELLQRAAAALCDLPTDRLDVERRVLAVEGSRGTAPETVLLPLWYGARGPGLGAYAEFGLRGAGAAEVTEHARHWFCRGNAALVLTGALAGEAMTLRLPGGPRRPPSPAIARTYDELPAEVPQPGSPLALGAPLPDLPETTLLASLLERCAWAALRDARGLAYEVRCRAERVSAEERIVLLTTDVEERDASPAGRALVEEVQRIAAGDFTAEELDAVRRDAERAVLAAPPVAPGALAAGSELIRGNARLPNDALDDWRAATREEVVSMAVALAERMLLACPESATSSLLPAIDLFAAPPVEGRRFPARAFSRHVVNHDVVVGEEGVSTLLGDGEAATVRYATCVAAIRGLDGGLTLVDESGDTVRLDPADLRDGAAAVAAAEAGIHPALIVPADERLMRVQESPGRRLRPPMAGEAAEILAGRLGSDERVLLTAEASQGVRAGALAVTDRRLLFAAKVLSEHVQEIPLASISRLRRKPNPLWPALTVEHDGRRTTFTFVTVGRLKEAADAVSAARRGQRGATPGG